MKLLYHNSYGLILIYRNWPIPFSFSRHIQIQIEFHWLTAMPFPTLFSEL